MSASTSKTEDISTSNTLEIDSVHNGESNGDHIHTGLHEFWLGPGTIDLAQQSFSHLAHCATSEEKSLSDDEFQYDSDADLLDTVYVASQVSNGSMPSNASVTSEASTEDSFDSNCSNISDTSNMPNALAAPGDSNPLNLLLHNAPRSSAAGNVTFGFPCRHKTSHECIKIAARENTACARQHRLSGMKAEGDNDEEQLLPELLRVAVLYFPDLSQGHERTCNHQNGLRTKERK